MENGKSGPNFDQLVDFQTIGIFLQPLYDLVYNATLDWYVGFIYCMSCILLIFMLLCLSYVFFLTRKYSLKTPPKPLSA